MPINLTATADSRSQTAAKHIQYAADKTGVDFNYLLQTAKRESAFNPDAQAKTSSATGLFQFVRQTWYETLHDFGGKHGYQNYAQNIQRDKNGRYFVPNQQAKNAILELRKDPKAASLMAAEFSKQNTQYLENKIGRTPIPSELYMAHFMGRGSAAKLIELEQRAPNMKANEVFPNHAASNKPIFYHKGQARTIAQVYDNLAKHHVQIARAKGLDPTNIENVAKLVPFLPSNDGFFGSLFGQQNNQRQEIKPLAYTGMGADNAPKSQSAFMQLNNLLAAQMAGQTQTNNQTISDNPSRLPEVMFSKLDTAAIAKGKNLFSVTSK